MNTKKTDFYITYHHSDEMAARWIAAVLKQARFSTLSDSWDFLPGEAPIKKIEYMFTVAQNAMVLISPRFIQTLPRDTGSLLESVSLDSKLSPLLRAKSQELRAYLVRIDACEIEAVLGPMKFLDLVGIDAKEAEKRLLEAVGGGRVEQKEIVPLPGSAKTREELLVQRKQEMDQLLVSTIKKNYHMKLDLEQKVLKEVEVKDEKTREFEEEEQWTRPALEDSKKSVKKKKEKRMEWVWEPVPLESLLRDGQNYILVNPSGLGKTTFLTFAACALLDIDAPYPFLPLFFTCIGLNNRAGTIEDFIRRQVESIYTSSQGKLVSRDWENLCILIDALDQARDVDDIVSSLLLHDKPLHYKKAKIILSSRQNTADKVKEGFVKIRLKLPRADEVRHYLGEENYQKLAGIIEASGELVKAPVLLEMLKAITEKGHVVSTLFNRADLYTEFTKVLMDQERSKPRFWQDRLSIRHFIDFELEQVLEKIAFFSLADNEILEIPKEKLAQYCESPEKKEALLNIGIILELFEDREQKMVFRHQSFQAYFAARYIYYQQPKLFREIVDDVTFFYNDVWYEVMRFFVGLEKKPKKAEVIIDAIYRRKDKKNDLKQALKLIFAFYLMSEARMDSEFIQRVYAQLVDLLINNKQYLYFFTSNSDKFNKGNDEQRRLNIIIFEPLTMDNSSDAFCDIVEALGNIGATEHIPLVKPLLRDKDENVRIVATEALGKIVKAGDITILKPPLRDKYLYVRIAAVEALGKIGTVKDIPLLKPLLKDEDFDVRVKAIEAFWKIGKLKDISLLELLLRDKYFRKDTVEDLAKIKKFGNISLLKILLRDEVWSIRTAAVKALGKIGTSKDIPLLIPLLRDEVWCVRHAAIIALGKIGTDEHVPLLKPLLSDEDKGIRGASVKSLVKIIKFRDIQLLEPLIKDEHRHARSAAAYALGNIGTAKDIPLLQPLLSDKWWHVRRAAVVALGKIGTSRDIPLLEPLLRDEKLGVFLAAIEAFGNIGTSEQIPLLAPILRDHLGLARSAATKALGRIVSTRDILLMEPLLRDIDENVRRNAVEIVGKIGSAKDINLLYSMLKDNVYKVRKSAARALENIVKVLDIPLLKPLLKDEDILLRLSATEALGEIGTTKDIPLLKPLLRDKSSVVRRAAANALGKIGKVKDIHLIKPLLRDKSSDVHDGAVEALGNMLKNLDIHLLKPLLNDEDILVSRYATNAFWKIITSKDIPLLKPFLSDWDSNIRKDAVKALGKIGTAKDIPLLEPLIRDKDDWVRCATIDVWGKLGTTANLQLLEPLLRDKDECVRRTALEAIENIYKHSTPKLCLDRVLPTKKEKKVLPVKLFSGQALHILHISDIHYAVKNEPTITCIFHEFLEDINKWRSQQNHTKIRTICLTGDIAAKGQKDEYDAIHEKINAILDTTGCPQENLFIIPGNHDVQEYDHISPPGQTLLEQVRDNEIDIDTGVLGSAEHYRLFLDKFANYYRFIEKNGYHSSLPEYRLPIPNLPNPWYNRKLKDYPVRIMGLNSALFCLKGYIEYGKIRMGSHQFHEAYFQGKGNEKGKAGDARDPEVVILLTHHPLNWLAESEYDDYSTLMERYAVLHLHGHIHKTKIVKEEKLFSSSGGYVSIGTGSLYGEKGKEDINTYHIITLDFENQELHVWARRWNPDTGKWTVYDDDGNNRFPFPIKRL